MLRLQANPQTGADEHQVIADLLAADPGTPERAAGPLIRIGVGLLAALLVAAIAAVFLVRESPSLALAAGGLVLTLTGIGAFALMRPIAHGNARTRQSLPATDDLLESLDEPAALTTRSGRPLRTNAVWTAHFAHGHPERLAETDADRDAITRLRLAAAGGSTDSAEMTIGTSRFRITAAPARGALFWRISDLQPATAGIIGLEDLDTILADPCTGLCLVDPNDEAVWINPVLAGWLCVSSVKDIPPLTCLSLTDRSHATLRGGDGGTLHKRHVQLEDGRLLIAVNRHFEATDTFDDISALSTALFESAPVGVAIINRDGAIMACNPAFSHIAPGWKTTSEDSLFNHVAPEDENRLRDLLARLLANSEKSESLEISLSMDPPRSGEIYLARLNANGADSRVLVHLIDTSRHKSLERQFVQVQKMQAVGQLAGGVAHDFNNLLTAIIGFCDLLLVRHGPGDQSFSEIMQIKQNANRAANLVRQLLAFSRQQTMRPKVLQLTDILADLANLLRRLIGETIELQMIHGRDLAPVRADQGQLEQVIINLAVNARDAMPQGGKLVIRTSTVGPGDRHVQAYSIMPAAQYVMIEISDSGHGIPEDIRGKIFDPFFTTKKVGQGTGLGLSTVYGIVKQTGGFIFAESAEDKGAIFRIFLPAYTESASPDDISDEQETEKTKDLTGKGTVLIVEDEDAVRLFAARALTNKGYTVMQAHSGEAAMELLREAEDNVDLLISDVVMPHMDGPTLVTEARKLCPDLRIIFISGYAEEVFRESVSTGSEDYLFLAKPFSLKQLAETVKDVLG